MAVGWADIYSSRPSIPGWLTRPDRGGEKVQRVPELDWRVKCRKQRPADNRNRSRNPSPNACIAMVAQEGDIAWVMSFTRLPFGFVVPEQAEGKKKPEKKNRGRPSKKLGENNEWFAGDD